MAEAIGLASSIIAFIEFAAKVASRLNQFSNDIKDGANALTQIQTQLPVIIDGLGRIKDRADSGKLDDRAKAALEPIVLACHKQTKFLSDTLDSVLPASDASKWERRKKVIQSLATDGKVKKTSEALSQYLQTLAFYHSIGEARTNSAVKKAFWIVPFDRNPAFVGREDVFGQIDQSLKVPEETQPKVALCGLGGIGKSQIALEYCFRQRRQKPTCSVFWVNAATVARFEESFQRLANGLGLDSRGNAQNDSLVLVQSFLETESLEPWIMVVDNVDDEAVFFRQKCRNDKTPSQVLPRCPHGRLLFTSRTRHVAVDLASPAAPICVEFLTRQEGLELLRKRLGWDLPESQLIELLSELDHIPLAVTQAVSFILKRRKSVEQYLELYRMGDSTRGRLLSHEFLEHGRQEQTMESVARTWQISFEWIQNYHAKAAEILCLMGFYQHHGVPAQLLRSDDVDDFEFEDSIAVLQAFSLLDENKSQNSYSTHRLIQVTTKLWLEQKGPAQLERWALRALELLTLRFSPPDHTPANSYWEVCQTLLPHADIVLQQSFHIAKRQSDLDKAKLLFQTGGYISWTRESVRDVAIRSKKSLEIRQSYLGLKHPATLESMALHFWSLIHHECIDMPGFDSQRASAVGQSVLELRREVLGTRHPATIDTLSDFAFYLEKEGQFEQSVTLQREALELSTEVNGSLHIDTVNCMACLARVLDRVGRFEEAVEVATEAAKIRTNILGPGHRTVLTARANLAYYLEHVGRVEEAIEMNRNVMTLEKQVLGPDHPEVLDTATNLVILLAEENRHTEVLDVLNDVLSTIQVSRRGYGGQTRVKELTELKLMYEHELTAKQLQRIDLGFEFSEESARGDK